MSDSRDGGSAFPVMLRVDDIAMAQEEGMTLRDYFAAKALSAMDFDKILSEAKTEANEVVKHRAWICYSIADAMIAERERDR